MESLLEHFKPDAAAEESTRLENHLAKIRRDKKQIRDKKLLELDPSRITIAQNDETIFDAAHH